MDNNTNQNTWSLPLCFIHTHLLSCVIQNILLHPSLFFKNNFIFMIPYLPYNYHPHSFLHQILMFVKSYNMKTSAHLYPTITFHYIRVNKYEQLSLPDFDQEDTISFLMWSLFYLNSSLLEIYPTLLSRWKIVLVVELLGSIAH